MKRGYAQTPMSKTDKRPYKRRTQTMLARTTYVPRPFKKTEWKYSDIAIGATMDTSGALVLLNGLVPGTGGSQRIGQNVTIMSVEIRVLNFVTAATGVDQVHRWAIVQDKQCNGTAMTGALYLNAATIYGLRLLDNRKRFKTHVDQDIYLNASGESDSAKYTHYYRYFKQPITVEYNTGNAGTVADIQSNSVYLYLIGSSAPGVTAGTCNGYARIRYTDA